MRRRFSRVPVGSRRYRMASMIRLGYFGDSFEGTSDQTDMTLTRPNNNCIIHGGPSKKTCLVLVGLPFSAFIAGCR